MVHATAISLQSFALRRDRDPTPFCCKPGYPKAAQALLDHLVVRVEKGEYEWAWLGVRGGNVTPALVKAMDLPAESGAYLLEIVSTGPADRAGLRGADELAVVDERQVPVGGDVVTAVDGRPVRSFDDLLIYIALEAGPGQEVTLTLLRDGRPREVSVTLEPRPDTLAQETLPFNRP